LEPNYVIVVEIYKFHLKLVDTEYFSHFLGYEFKRSFELCHRLEADVLRDHLRKAIVYKYRLLESWAIHDIVRLDVHVNYMVLVESPQAFEKLPIV
jgi:hypothetical protein